MALEKDRILLQTRSFVTGYPTLDLFLFLLLACLVGVTSLRLRVYYTVTAPAASSICREGGLFGPD